MALDHRTVHHTVIVRKAKAEDRYSVVPGATGATVGTIAFPIAPAGAVTTAATTAATYIAEN